MNDDLLRETMRRWASGVGIATSKFEERRHGMTINSFTSISLAPPLVTITLAKNTRTHRLVVQSNIFAITFLAENQEEIALRFSGKNPVDRNRFDGLGTFSLTTGAPMIEGALAYLDCKVDHCYETPSSTLFIGEVLGSFRNEGLKPLLYYNREYHRMVL